MKIDVYLTVKFFKNTFFLFSALLALNSCKNDLSINAPYKETPTVYAVLCPQEKIHMIRINKVFLGESDANAMAQISDSINYQPGDLTVTLTRSVNGSPANASDAPYSNQTVTFRDSMITADAGAFNTNQRVYVSSEKLFTTGDYKLTIYNNKTKNTFTAKATAIDSVAPSGWHPFVQQYYPLPANAPVNNDNYINYSSVGSTYTARYGYKDPAKVYQLVMRLHYWDQYGSNYDFKYADFTFNNQYSKDLKGQTNFVTTFKGQSLYDAIGTALSKSSAPVSAINGRKMYKIEFLVYSSTQDYIDYLQFAAPSLNISQQKPLYSNFENSAAIGIFTFRSRSSIQKTMDNSFISEFATNPATCSYKFFNAGGSLPGCQ